ncbi:LacI family DNA-binding transcriptional regulator [Isoptericola variabilis]|uniref:Transcriptional regulator, LacI family n=3 Tax=Isoptericola TaxID=254250 RepID=F6FWA0_ISOV2|nr:LacI family DNA-binding transcriptional regulator [Isoptericola variabilis]AEG45644.1 transcriptional regulator, LacI family [Isoptericola variabilis 225]
MRESSVTIHDVARHAGVSAASVSNYLNWPDRLSNRMKRRVEASIAELGFVPSMPARQLRRQRSGIVGLSVVNASNPYFAGIATAVEKVAADAGLAVVTGSSHESAAQQEQFLTLFEQLRFDGVVVAPSDDELEPLRRRRERGTPVVLVDHDDPERRLSSVSIDHREGGRLAVRHLLAAGRRRLLFAAGPEGVRQVQSRIDGCHDVVAAVPGVVLEVVRSADLDLEVGQDVGHWVAGLPADRRPDAVFAGNDLHAIGIVNALTRAGVRVPDDVAVVGYDDIPFAAMAAVPLTTVRQPIAQIGAAAARLLLDEIAEPGREPRDVVFPPELVVRAST